MKRRKKRGLYSMTTAQREPLYASTAKPWLKYYDQKYIDMPLPKCSAFEYLCHQNKNHLSETALEYSCMAGSYTSSFFCRSRRGFGMGMAESRLRV